MLLHLQSVPDQLPDRERRSERAGGPTVPPGRARILLGAARYNHCVITLVLATEHGLFIARHALDWTVERHLDGRGVYCIAVDAFAPSHVYCGTMGDGLWRSDDMGHSWEPAGSGIPHPAITSATVSATEQEQDLGVVYAGTEPSGVFRSTDGGSTWSGMPALLALPSKPTWSFPPRPDTNHVRWIEADPVLPGRLYVAIEAGALVRTSDGGRTWEDRVPTGPYDTHTAATHRLAPGRVYSSAGDGYFETHDAGRTWTRRVEGLEQRYLVGVAVHQEDPESVLVSCADGPWTAYDPPQAEAYIYHRSARRDWHLAMEGFAAAQGTSVSQLTTHPDAPQMVYAANNRGVFHTHDAGRRWHHLEIAWPEGALIDGVHALAVIVE